MTDDERPDARQLVMGRDFALALQRVGVMPRDCYTRGATIRIKPDDVVIAEIEVLLPADKLRQALDIVSPPDPNLKMDAPLGDKP